MTILLAPVPIIHVQAMLEDMKLGHKRFAFGSGSWEFFEKNVSKNCEDENLLAYLYVSKAGESQLRSDVDKQLGIFVQGRLCGWTLGDHRGQYPRTASAHRPSSTIENDGPMTLFWEIDNVTRLPERLAISEFFTVNSKPFSDNFVPQGPMFVNRKSKNKL